MEGIYIQLKSDRPTERALRQRLTRKKMAKRFKLVKDLKSAKMVVTSTADLKSLPKKLPSKIRLLQLTDCGGAQRYLGASKLEIANATRLFEKVIAPATLDVLRTAGAEVQRSSDRRSLELGIVGLGNIGYQILQWLDVFLKSQEQGKRPRELPFDSIAINEYRSLVEGERCRLRNEFDRSGTSIRWDSLLRTLFTSNIVIVAVHRGPTADPLIGAQEAGLIDPNSWLIDLSEEGVVDQSAFDPEHNVRPVPTYVRLDDFSESMKDRNGMGLGFPPAEIARHVEENLKNPKGRGKESMFIPIR